MKEHLGTFSQTKVYGLKIEFKKCLRTKILIKSWFYLYSRNSYNYIIPNIQSFFKLILSSS